MNENLSEPGQIVDKNLIEIKHLYKKYINQDEYALRDINLGMADQEITGIIGPNGAGKSTLIKIMLGVLTPSKGQVTALGLDPKNYTNDHKKKIAVYLGGKSNLLYHLSILESVKYFAALYGVNKADLEQRVSRYSKLLAIDDILAQRVATLSLGQRLRAELLCLFIYHPKLVFLDEPTIGLDIEGKRQFRKLLYTMKEVCGSSIILTTHDINDLEKIADRIILLQKGRALLDLSRQEFSHLLSEKTVVITDVCMDKDEACFTLLEENRGRYRYLMDTVHVPTFQQEAGSTQYKYYVEERPNLEDLFYEYFV